MSCEFGMILQCYRERFEDAFSIQNIEITGRQHKALCQSYQRKPSLESSIDSFDGVSSIRSAWIELKGIHMLPVRFLGGLAALLPDTATAENDF